MVKAKAEITISKIIDIEKTVRYYLLQSSTSSVPSKPTSNPPGGNWITTEPSYTTGSTNTLYFVDLTIMSDGSFSYSAVSKSSSYEAAKAAYNKAVSAESSANSANSKIDNLKVGGRNLIAISTSIDNKRIVENYNYDNLYADTGFRTSALISCKEGDSFTLSSFAEGVLSFGWINSNKNVFSRPTGYYTVTSKYSKTFIAPSGTAYCAVSWSKNNLDHNLKLEKGTMATDWTPAPEDLETRVTNAETQISSNKEAIDLRATKTEVTTAKNDAIAAAEKYSDAQLTTKANAITSAVTELSKDYNGYKQSSTTAIQNAQGWQLNWDKILNGKEANINKHTDYITFKDGNIKLGDSESTKTLEISNENIQIRNGEDPVASFGESVLLGKPDNIHVLVSKSGFEVYGNATANPVAQVLYGTVQDPNKQDVESCYFTFGERNIENGIGQYSFVGGDSCQASAYASHAEGLQTKSLALSSHTEGCFSIASNEAAHAEGYDTEASGLNSHAEGLGTKASGSYSHAEGDKTFATGDYSHAEGSGTTASGSYSHAEGCNTAASGIYSHAANNGSVASGDYSTAIINGIATGEGSLAAFPGSQAKHTYAAAMGQGAITGKANQTVIGYYNAVDSNALFVVGNGSSDAARSNCFSINPDGGYGGTGIAYASRFNGCYQNNVADNYFETPVPLYIDANALGRNNYHICMGYGGSFIRFRNDGSAFYIMNGDGNSWTNYITFYTGGGVVVPNTLKVPTCLYVPYATKASTTSAANAYISADGNGVLAKTSKTSSRRFKDSITPELDDDLNPERLYDVDVIQFKYKKDYFTNEDDIRYRKNMIGLIAEDVYDKYKIAADWHVDEDSGEVLVDGWNEQYIIPALLKLIQNQHKELQEQRKEIDQLKETVDMLMKDYKERQSK
nr:MAG TPA: hypothetical protein [Caudoviricetes sp.]